MAGPACSRGCRILNSDADFAAVLQRFELSGHVASVETVDSGHINRTFLVRITHANGTKRYVLQRINSHVFPNPTAVMENIDRVTTHIGSRAASQAADRLSQQSQLILIRSRDGESFVNDGDGSFWRLWPYIYGASTFDTAQSGKTAYGAAAAFGNFQSLVHDLPGPRLQEIIPDFHNTPARYEQFRTALESDTCGRAKRCAQEIENAMRFEESAGALCLMHERGELPERIVHNDAKINNVLFDDKTGLPVCVIDLDTVMPGLALYDFGDLVRTVAMPVAEDARDLDSVVLQLDLYEQLVAGYIDSTIDFLSDAETEHLALAGKIITVETGLRFLTDYLAGDTYFRIHRPEQNLDRARTQFALAASIEEHFQSMQSITSDARAGHAQRMSNQQ